MKKIIFLISIIIFLQLATALDFEVTQENLDNILIADTNMPLFFDLSIKNLGSDDYLEFYNLQGFDIYPVGTIPIQKGETKKIELKIVPIGSPKERGQYTFNYFIKGSSEIKETLSFEILELREVIEIGSEKINLDDNTIQVYVQNIQDVNLENITTKLKSDFFEIEKIFSLTPNERKEFEIELEGQDASRLAAGFYTISAKVEYLGAKENIEGMIKYEERKDLQSTKEKSGFFVKKEIFKKTNKGNVDAKTITSVNKSLLASVFTSLTPEPDITERKGTEVFYIWEQILEPGELMIVKAKTNYIYPILIVVLIVFIVFYLRIYLTNDLVLKKKINFMHTKTDQLALKVSIMISAKRHVSNVNIIDRLPALVKLHTKFGGEIPARADEKKRRVEWNFGSLGAGEKRIVSYIIYSKIGVLGKFALPSAAAIYEREGKIKETESNKSYFMAEEKGKDKDDD